jgi:antiviral helicase SLH1
LCRFTAGIVDALNAEISLGTVANINDAVQWLGYTYLFVRMRKNPFQYGNVNCISHETPYSLYTGLPRDEPADDPYLINKRNILAAAAAGELQEARMIAFDQSRGDLVITDLGRIAARYYIRVKSIKIFLEKFRPVMSEADVLTMLSMSTEVSFR